MSLIDEALKRARMEAAQKAAEDEGLPYPAIPRHLGPRRRQAWLAPAIVAVAVLLGLLAGWWIASRGPRAEQNAAGAEAVDSDPAVPTEMAHGPLAAGRQSAEPAGSAPAAPPGAEQLGTPPPAREPAAVEPIAPAELARDPVAATPPAPARLRQGEAATSRREPTRSSPAAPPESDPATPPAVVPAERAPASPPEPSRAVTPPGQTPDERPSTESRSGGDRAARPTTAPPRQPAAPAESPAAAKTVTDPDSGVLLVLPERQRDSGSETPTESAVESHVQRFALPQGGTIELGGIAWSETGPFALINGRVVGPGAVIQGYTLERIRPGHVELTGEGRRIQLSLQ